ncbi:MAG TPA: nucleotidyltransferase domain-containing protein [Phycisphaerae bacterium]|nr:nucleotidyltransferase domain-containing protein [Phycisphaerae bacterium]
MADRLVAEFRPCRVYLFGSYAWGEPSEDSDIDVMVVVDEMPESPTRMARRAYRRLRGLSHFPTDILFRRTASFDRQAEDPATLEHEIARRGELLHG